MLRAAVAELGADHRLAVEPWIGEYAVRARLGLYQKLWLKRLGPAAGVPAGVLPRRIRRWLGVVTEREIAGVLDAAGFAYGDQVGAARTERAAADAGRWRANGQKVILLPQALGPFTSRRIRVAATRLIERSDLVFARDPVSLAAVRDLGVDDGHVGLAPDFTIGLPATPVPAPTTGPHGYVIPNSKVVTFGGAASEQRYLEFLVGCIRALERRSVRPFILIHEGREDATIAEALRAAAGAGVEVLREDDPLALKGLIGQCQVVIGSRFHGLVSALAQAVPVVAVGWSHKYAGLLADYGVPEALVSLDPEAGGTGQVDVEAWVGPALDEPARSRTVATIRAAATRQQALTAAMWQRVRAVLSSAPARG